MFQQQQAEEAARLLMQQQQQAFQGSSGASAFQRVGLATNEFFDTRKPKDPAADTKRAADFAKQILDVLKKGEPLVLNPTSS
jgi:type II secretory pathway pseudopilin PulG